MPRIFVSYRREDTFHITGRLGDRLRARYGADNVFVDVNSNEAGVAYQQTTLAALRASDVVLVVIGDRWLGRRGFLSRQGSGIHSPQSLARLEIEAALLAGIPIVPVLVDGTRMPGVSQLPASIAGLSGIHARRLDAGEDFDHHTRRLIERIDAVVAKPSTARSALAEGPTQEPAGARATPAFVVAPAPAGEVWEGPAAPVRFAPDRTTRGLLQRAPDQQVALDSIWRAIDRKQRLRIAGATAVLVLPLMVLSAIVFSTLEWKFLGLSSGPDGGTFSGFAAASVLFIVFIAFRCRRWNALYRLELASYWLAASASIIVGFFILSLAAKSSVFRFENGGFGTVIGGAIVLATGLFLLARHWNNWIRRELPIYWIGCCAGSLAVILPVVTFYMSREAGMPLLACVLELCLGALLVWWQRGSLTLRDYVIFWVGAALLGALMSGLIFAVMGWNPLPFSGPAGQHGFVLWTAVVALSAGYWIFRHGRRLSLWERTLCAAVATEFVWSGVAFLPLTPPEQWISGAVAGAIFMAIALLPRSRQVLLML